MTLKTHLPRAVINLIPASGGVLLGLAWGAHLSTVTAVLCQAAGIVLVVAGIVFRPGHIDQNKAA